ncbi:MAG: helix-turn-helix domain-containing protein [Bacteroidota bacterium]
MIDEQSSLKFIFGLKVRELRLENDLSFQELSAATGLSISYLSEIEKGKKYPKGDKILQLAQALRVEYDQLVSLRVSKRLAPIVRVLQSDFFREFPLDMFGLDAQKIIELISGAPEKINAFLSTLLQLARHYEMRTDQFYGVALRAYQDLYDNYFPDIEEAVEQFREDYSFTKEIPVTSSALESILQDQFGTKINRSELPKSPVLNHVRSMFHAKRKELMINSGLTTAQENFLMGRELAFQYLKLKDRPQVTPPQQPGTFEELLNNYKASYFSAALLLEKKTIIQDVKRFARLRKWNETALLQFLKKYEATPEMLFQRLTNILPTYFGIKNLFFLRFIGTDDFSNYELNKELHLSQFHSPHANQLNEHYCRRWISINIIKDLRSQQRLEPKQRVMAGSQISKYWKTANQYLCLSIAKSNESNPDESISVTVGFLIDSKLKKQIQFLSDPNLVTKTVHTTCERCAISDCQVRMAPPLVIEQENRRAMVQKELNKIMSN